MEEQLNCELNACLLRYVISASNKHDHQTLCEMGLDIALMERVKGMNADVFTRLSKFNIADVTFNSHRFGLMLDFVEHERTMDALMNEMIKLGASQSMLEDLVGVDPRDYRDRRKTLGMAPATQGRPPDLDAQQANAVYEAMKKYPEKENEDNLPNWYCLLGKETGLPLSIIWQHLKFG